MKTDKKNLKLILQDVAEDKKFWCIDGKVLNNLKELGDAISKMDDKTFNYHVSPEKNDFVTWIYNVMGDIQLAKDLENVLDKKITTKKIKARIEYINKQTYKFQI